MPALAGLHSHLPAFLRALSMNLFTHLTYQPQAGPALCYVGLWGERGVWPKGLSHGNCTYYSFLSCFLLLFSGLSSKVPSSRKLSLNHSLGPVPTLDSSSSWVPSFQPCLL